MEHFFRFRFYIKIYWIVLNKLFDTTTTFTLEENIRWVLIHHEYTDTMKNTIDFHFNQREQMKHHHFMQSPTLQPAAELDIFPSAPSTKYEKNKMDDKRDKIFNSGK